ncbi:unnamed protein product [Xylocopa violacea]|uniref:Uncharacterized protein n=1 Tax=Xylocopa violacea TaxID=135666 RepID=A0ABP1NBS4_XYLVO
MKRAIAVYSSRNSTSISMTSANDLKELGIRPNIKGLIIQFFNYMAKYEEDPDPTKLTIKLDRLKEKYSTFDNIQTCVEPSDETEDADRLELEDRYVDAVTTAQKLLKNSNRDEDTNIHNIRLKTPRSEMEDATKAIVKLVQQEMFDRDLQSLHKTGKVHAKNNLIMLNPFLDTDNVIRVGGRLTHAKIPYNAQEPIIVPKSHHVVSLLIQHYHTENSILHTKKNVCY